MTMEYVSGWNLEEFLERHSETDQYIPADLAVFIVSGFVGVLPTPTVKKTVMEDLSESCTAMLIRKIL